MESYRDFYPACLRSRIRYIPNPVPEFNQLAEPAKEYYDSIKIVLNLGRLSYQKNQETLLRAFSRIAADFPQWKLRLVGDGEERKSLVELTDKLSMHKQVEFAGSVVNTSSEYAKANLFCFPSLWEGFPNALAEAMAHGLPVIGFSACAGTNVLIKNGVNGLLVEDGFSEIKLAEAMALLMMDDEKRKILGSNALAITQQFSPEVIFTQWENLFVEMKK